MHETTRGNEDDIKSYCFVLEEKTHYLVAREKLRTRDAQISSKHSNLC